MPDTPRHVLALWALGLVAVVLLGARYLRSGSEPAASAAPPIRVGDATDDGASGVTVHVAGAVRRPGVYRLPARDRVVDAVHRAGGARRRADPSALKLPPKLQGRRPGRLPPPP